MKTRLKNYISAIENSDAPKTVKDQKSLQKALRQIELETKILDNNLNFRANFGGVITDRVSVFTRT